MDQPERFRARDISYASVARSKSGRAIVRLMENSTGRLGLIRRASGYAQDMADGDSFFDAISRRYGLTLDVVGGSLDSVPATGPVILLANHPYGILDGLMLGQIMAHRRRDFKLMAHSVFGGAPDLTRHLLPISFQGDRAGRDQNLGTRKAALAHLGQGGAIGIFPGGTVSTGARPFAKPMDPGWRSFTARMIGKSDATVIPVFFDGHTSRLFQIASHIHHTLRMGLLIREFNARVDTPVRVVIGNPIGRNVLNPLSKDAKAMMDFLRKATYELSPDPVQSFDLGYEF